jgi:hypothetical protein
MGGPQPYGMMQPGVGMMPQQVSVPALCEFHALYRPT